MTAVLLSSDRAFTDFVAKMQRKHPSWMNRNFWRDPIPLALTKRYDTETEIHRLAIQ